MRENNKNIVKTCRVTKRADALLNAIVSVLIRNGVLISGDVPSVSTALTLYYEKMAENRMGREQLMFDTLCRIYEVSNAMKELYPDEIRRLAKEIENEFLEKVRLQS